MSARHDLEELIAGIRARDRATLGRAITLVESRRPADREPAQELLQRLLPDTGGACRVGITGSPGVGKSTFIEALGGRLTRQGRRVAVLAVDPSSRRTGGSILGDKTRMPRLAIDPEAFIRPSPSGGTLGGVARRTRESMLICEAAGFDVVLVETVGTGQSETAVADMVDLFLLLLLPGGGDDLQGIKRGVLELADLIAINKADGSGLERARQTAADYGAALRILTPRDAAWTPEVLLVSALEGRGIAELWQRVESHREALGDVLEERRSAQRLQWMWSLVEERAIVAVRRHPRVLELAPELEREVESGKLSATLAADRLLTAAGAVPTG
ncbi:MAG TPA: methylmalonyl Co-A mutase-associated GTPase MeaB [Thermoanaerobaculia bacterium]|nr:methylmalonyl Co-A mutase-associated GTPase MeaB [Thermoanaerobaculia bacterium]